MTADTVIADVLDLNGEKKGAGRMLFFETVSQVSFFCSSVMVEVPLNSSKQKITTCKLPLSGM